MKGFLKYMFVAPFKYIQRDKREYDMLCQDLENIEGDVQKLNQNITKHSATLPGCIERKPVFIENENDPEHSVFYVKTDFCASFSLSRPCTKENCHMHADNHKYLARLDDFQAALQKKENFWKNKLRGLQK